MKNIKKSINKKQNHWLNQLPQIAFDGTRSAVKSLNAYFNALPLKRKKAIAITSGVVVALFTFLQVIFSLGSDQSLMAMPTQLSDPASPAGPVSTSPPVDPAYWLREDSLVSIGTMKAIDSSNTILLSIAITAEGKYMMARMSESNSLLSAWRVVTIDQLQRIEEDYVFTPTTDSLIIHR